MLTASLQQNTGCWWQSKPVGSWLGNNISLESLGTSSKISAPHSEVGSSTSFILGDIQPPAQFGSKMILTNTGRFDRQAAEPGDQNTGWKAGEGKDVQQKKRGKCYGDGARGTGPVASLLQLWRKLQTSQCEGGAMTKNQGKGMSSTSLEFWCQGKPGGIREQIQQ